MKPYLFTPLVFLSFLFLVLTLSSCQKARNSKNIESTQDEQLTTTTQIANASPVTYCSETIVSLCYKKSNLHVGYVKIKRGSDNNVYITYRTAPSFYLMEVNLFCGEASAIPSSFTKFTNRKTFGSPYPAQEHTFVISNPPVSFIIVAEALTIKKAANGNLTGDIKQGWANGCQGPSLCTSHGKNASNCGDLEWGSFLYYSDPANCFIQGPGIAIEPDICAFPIQTFFGVHPFYKIIKPWSDPSVSVGSYYYSELEARAIAEAFNNVVVPDATYAFLRVATLKLSYTGVTLSPTLSAAVQTIESNLSAMEKLTPEQHPAASAEVISAALLINQFIEKHPCPWRIE